MTIDAIRERYAAPVLGDDETDGWEPERDGPGWDEPVEESDDDDEDADSEADADADEDAA